MNEIQTKVLAAREQNNKLLDARSWEGLGHRLGINGARAKTLQEIGDMYNLTRERVRQLEKNAFDTLGIGSSKDSILINRLAREEKFDKESIDILEAITPLRFETRRPFSEIAKMLGMDYTRHEFQNAMQMFYKKHKNTPEAEIMTDELMAMVEYKQKHPFITQIELAKKFNIHSPVISRKFKRLGLEWKDVRSMEGYVRPS